MPTRSNLSASCVPFLADSFFKVSTPKVPSQWHPSFNPAIMHINLIQKPDRIHATKGLLDSSTCQIIWSNYQTDMATKKKKTDFTLEDQNNLRKLERAAKEADGEVHAFATDEPENELGKRLEFQRRAKALTQGQLADLTQKADLAGKGLSRSVISLYELGINRPGIKEVRLLCEVLRVSPSYLIYGDEHPFQSTARIQHFEGIANTEPEYFARMVYCLWRLDPHFTIPIMKMVMNTLGNNIEHLMEAHADRVFLEMSDDLRTILEKKNNET